MFYRRPFDPTPAYELVVIFARGNALAPGSAVLFDNTLEHDVFTIAQSQATRDLGPGPTRSGADSNLDRRSFKSHPCPFPVALPEAFIRHLADVGAWVLDPFAGAGSTIIAANAAGRRGAGIEIDPAYCDVTCLRYQQLTGDHPVLARTGDRVDFGHLSLAWHRPDEAPDD